MRNCPKCGTPYLQTHRYCPGCAADLSQIVSSDDVESLLNTTVAHQFVLREVIGTGGMGKVYRADQLGVGRSVAVKIMHRHLLGDATAAARFINEARASSQLNHPHSIAGLDFGQSESGMLYIVMEYLRGTSLDVVLREDFPLPLGRIAQIMAQALGAVEAAHQQNIIHRDLKPENIFLLDHDGPTDFVKVLDFGIAKMLDLEDRSVTTPGLVPGTPEYMSPEQARGEKLDPRSDVYAMGVILDELITGTVPFKGPSAIATMMSHVQDPVEPPSRRRPDLEVPAALEAIVTWALSKQSGDRMESADQFREVITAWAQVAGVWQPEFEKPEPSADSDLLLEFYSEDQAADLIRSDTYQRVDSVVPGTPRATALGEERAGTRAEQRPMFGREQEMQRIESFLDAAGPRAMRIEGDHGIGKTRLAEDLLRAALNRGYLAIAIDAEPGWIPAPLAGVRRAVLGCLSLRGCDLKSDEVTSEALVKGLKALEVEAADIPGILDIFGYETHLLQLDADARQRERSTAFRQLLARTAADGTLVVLFEDLDRYDEPSRDLVATLANMARGKVAVVLTLVSDTRQLWPEHVACINLGPLDREDTHSLASHLLQRGAEPQLEQRIVDASQGHPLYAKQLAQEAAARRVGAPPERLADFIAAQLERMDQDERQVLQWLAVLQLPLRLDELPHVLGKPVDPALLVALRDRGMVEVDNGICAFAHRFIGTVTYSSIPVAVRREMHQRVLELFSAADHDTLDAAHHAYQADSGMDAIVALERAGERCQIVLDMEAAMRCYTNAIDLVRREWGRGRIAPAELDGIGTSVALKLGEVLSNRGDAHTAVGVLGEMLSAGAPDELARARLRLALGRIELARANVHLALRQLQLARADAQTANADALLAEINTELALANGLSSDRGLAGRLIIEALEAAKRAEGTASGAASAKTLFATAVTCARIGFLGRARSYLTEALARAEAEQALPVAVAILLEMVKAHQSYGEWGDAETRALQALALVTQIGDRTHRADMLLTLGRLRRIAGDPNAAEHYLEEGLQLAQSIAWWEGIRRAEQEREMLRFASPDAEL